MVLGIWGVQKTYDELKTVRFYKDVVCEFLLTFWLIVGVVMSNMNFPNLRPANLYAGNVIGLYVMSLVEGFGHVQKCVMNPNFSLLFVLQNSMSVVKGIIYIGVQLAATASGAIFVYNITPEENRAMIRTPGAVDGISTAGNWVAEAVAVASLGVVIIGSGEADKKRTMMPGLAIGFCVMSTATVGAPWGVNLNPAVVFAWCVLTNDWGRLWIYWTSGFAGVIVTVLLYNFFVYDGPLVQTNKEALQRFPSMNRTISRAISSDSGVIYDSNVLTRMDSMEPPGKADQDFAKNNYLIGNSVANGYQITQPNTDIRL